MNREAVRPAFAQSVPVLFGYIFLGMAFGISMQQAGYGVGWAAASSLFIYAGAGQFMLVSLLANGYPLYLIACMTLLINSRHLFYGLTFIERFRTMGKRCFYMIFSLTDETYSVLCSANLDGDGMFLLALLNHCYWILGSVIGAAAGQLIPLDFTGIDFSMTALFVVLFIEQWRNVPWHVPALVGAASAWAGLLLLGAERFILPSLIVTVGILMLFRRYYEAAGEVPEDA